MNVAEALLKLGSDLSLNLQSGLAVTAPATGEVIANIAPDTAQDVDRKIAISVAAQEKWGAATRAERAEFLQYLATETKNQREALGRLITLEAGKTPKDALVEPDGSAGVLNKTIADTALPPTGDMLRSKEQTPVGVVGIITAYNYPLLVAQWSMAPALLAGNSVVWKPSEKTPLTAIGYEALFEKAAKDFNALKGREIVPANLLQVIVGERAIGEALVVHEQVDMVSATGSAAMGKNIKQAWSQKKNNDIQPILELGGNNAVVVSEKCTPEHLEFALNSILNSMLVTGGQRCTNTRRLIVHEDVYDIIIQGLKDKFTAFMASGGIANPLLGDSGPYDYAPLIDNGAYDRLQHAIQQAEQEGGTIVFGQRVMADKHPDAYYVQPTIAEMPSHSAVMDTEVFAPILFVTKYKGDIEQAIQMVNAPANAGLVNGIYTLSQEEADLFARRSEAGQTVINSAKGTGGTPGLGTGFGGNKESGQGMVLNSQDPLGPFTRKAKESRVAQNKDIPMNWGKS